VYHFDQTTQHRVLKIQSDHLQDAKAHAIHFLPTDSKEIETPQHAENLCQPEGQPLHPRVIDQNNHYVGGE
jgi:hypothetical protein